MEPMQDELSLLQDKESFLLQVCAGASAGTRVFCKITHYFVNILNHQKQIVGVLSDAFVHPIDTCRTRLQVQVCYARLSPKFLPNISARNWALQRHIRHSNQNHRSGGMAIALQRIYSGSQLFNPSTCTLFLRIRENEADGYAQHTYGRERFYRAFRCWMCC